MAAASTTSTIAYAFKTVYADGVGDVAMRDRPLFKRLAQKPNMGRTGLTYAVRYAQPQNSGTFSNAQSNASSSKGVQFLAAVRTKYVVITIDGVTLTMVEGDDDALVDVVTEETDAAVDGFGDTYSFDLFRNSNGTKGRRSSISTNTVTLTVANDARNFPIGATVIASPNENGSSPRTGSTTVSASNIDGGTVTLASAAAIDSFQDNDYLFVQGDPGTCIDGLAALFPLTAPVLSSDSFRGIDRGVAPSLLAGSRLDDSGSGIEDSAGRVAVKISQNGKRANLLVLNPVNFYAVSRRLNAKIEYASGGGEAQEGFETFKLSTTAGVLEAISDPSCPTTLGYVLNENNLYLSKKKDIPHIVDDDGKMNQRITDDDGIEIRGRSISNLICPVPASGGVFSIA